MAKLKAIPLQGGIISFADQEDIGESFSGNLVNADFTKPGVLSARVPSSLPKELPYNFFKIWYWSDKIGQADQEIEPIWIGLLESQGSDRSDEGDLEIWYIPASTNNFSDSQNWNLLCVLENWSKDTLNLVNLGGSIRIVPGWEAPPVYIDYIKRNFFNNEIEYDNYYVDRNSNPRPYWAIQDAEAMSGGQLQYSPNTFYYYKIAPVFDGVQVGALEDAIYKKVTIDTLDSQTAKLTIRIDTQDWNPRITHLNLYRGSATVDNEDAVTYYLVNTLRTTSSYEAPNISFNVNRVRSHAFIGTGNLGPGQCSVGGGAYTSSSTCASNSGTWATGLDIRSSFTGDGGDYLITGLKHPDPDGTAVLDNSVQQFNLGHSWLCKSVSNFKPMMMWQVGTVTGSDGVSTLQTQLECGSGYLDIASSNETAYYRSRNAGSHWRRIREVKEDFVITDWPFWKEDEWLETGTVDYDRSKGNGQWGIDASSEYCNAIISRINKLPGQGKSFSAWTKVDSGKSSVSIQNAGGTDEHLYFTHKNEYLTSGDSDWDDVYYHCTVDLEEAKWYFLTLSFERWETDTNVKASMYISKSSSAETDADLCKFESNINHVSDDKHGQIAGWFYLAGTGGTTQTVKVAVGVLQDADGVNAGYEDKHKVRQPGIFECLVPPTNQGWYGTDVIGVQKNIVAPATPAVSMEIGSSILISGDSSNERTVVDTQESTNMEMLQLDGEIDTTQTTGVTLNATYDIETVDGEEGLIDVIFKDGGFIDGEMHYNQDSSINLRYKHAQMINGRLIVGNILLDPTNQKEAHPNFLMFSELNKPDVIPTINYIAINDLGDGEITGLKELQGTLAVFSTTGIFRLNVPSYDPSQWSLLEASKGTGCEAVDGIVSVQSSIYFANETAIYVMDANFIPQEITRQIRNIYQKLYTKKIKLHHDIKDNKLYVLFESQVVYELHLNKFPKETTWVRYSDNPLKNDHNVLGNLSTNYNPTQLISDKDFTTWIFNNTGVGSNIRKLKAIPNNNEYEASDIFFANSFFKETGWIRLSTQDQKVTVRKIHVRYNSDRKLKLGLLVDEEEVFDQNNYWQAPQYNTYAKIKGTSDSQSNEHILDQNIVYDQSQGKWVSKVIETTEINDLGEEIVVEKTLPQSETIRCGLRCYSLKIVIQGQDMFLPLKRSEVLGIEVEYE